MFSKQINGIIERNQDKPLTPRKLEDTFVKRFKPSHEYGKWRPMRQKPVLVITEKPSFRYEIIPPYLHSPYTDFQRTHEKFYHSFSRKFPPPRKRFHPKMFNLPHQNILRSLWKISQETPWF